eukprot:1939212-Alexandrium_andersonii.AAC.1
MWCTSVRSCLAGPPWWMHGRRTFGHEPRGPLELGTQSPQMAPCSVSRQPKSSEVLLAVGAKPA